MKQRVLIGAIALAGMAGSMLVGASAAHSHGYITNTATEGELTARVAMDENKPHLGDIQYEPQSVEGHGDEGGAPLSGLTDGKIASAGVAMAAGLDKQSADLWAKQDVKTGPVKVNWNFTAPHKTDYYAYYITKQGWDPDKPLKKSDFEKVTHIERNGEIPALGGANAPQTLNIPADRSGYHVILGQWEIDDTRMAFYNVMDVNVQGKGVEDTEAPSVPGDLAASNVTHNSARLDWRPSKDNVGVTGYDVYRDGTKVSTTEGTSFTDKGLKAETAYTYQVVARDAAGNTSDKSTVLKVTTKAVPADTEAPTAPGHLHAHHTTSSEVMLMWSESSDDVAVTGYEIFRDGKKTGAVQDATTYTDKSVEPGTTYTYKVRALDGAGNTSEFSKSIEVKVPASDGTEIPEWDPKGTYEKGDKVTHKGTTYVCVQSHQGNGDPNWITALSLWQQA
ncbi:lytic polysaccharide monooxygenase [Streptomyces monticola]|uniref:Lytic polysaccharide monooxygenase n=1 Tax=Streptomyces monticola TaxID=2666263 RepID=A0ABW2JDP2_9ACTN